MYLVTSGAGLPMMGWSSHTRGYLDCVLAARLGAPAIEKHLCLTPSDLEAGHSLGVAKFHSMVAAISAATHKEEK